MNTPAPDDPSPRIAALQAELEAVKRREAEFRAKMVHEFLDRGERNTYLHVLREERAALVKREQESFADLEELTRMLEAEGEKAAALEAELGRIRRSWSWRLLAPLRAIGRRFEAQPPAAPVERAPAEPGVFNYYLHTSPFRIYRDSRFTLRGWAWPQDGRAVTAVRVNLGGRIFNGRHGLEEPEVIARFGPQAANPLPGFEITFETPPGRHSLSLEAQVEGAGWLWIMRTSIWCEPSRA
jgi:hypothetical protein